MQVIVQFCLFEDLPVFHFYHNTVYCTVVARSLPDPAECPDQTSVNTELS